MHTHTHSLNPLLTPLGSRHACKVLKRENAGFKVIGCSDHRNEVYPEKVTNTGC